MNDTWCLRVELRNLLPHPKLERRLKSTYTVLLLILLFALGTQFAVRPVDPDDRSVAALMDVSIAPESPFGLDRILKTAVVLLCAWAFDRLRGLSPLFVTVGAPFLATCVLLGLVAVASRFAHLAQVSKHMRRGGTWIDGIRPGDRTAEYLRRRAWPTLAWEVAFVAIALLAATLLPIRAHPLTFLGMWAVVEVCVSMYMHWKWVWRRDETLARRYGKYNPHTSTR